MVTLAIDALLVIFALGYLMARFPTVHTQSSALASSRAMAALLADKATQRVWDIWHHRDPRVTGCDVFWRLRRCKRQYYSISTTSAVSSPSGSGRSPTAKCNLANSGPRNERFLTCESGKLQCSLNPLIYIFFDSLTALTVLVSSTCSLT